MYGLTDRFMESPLIGDNISRSIFGGGGFLPVIYPCHSISM
jgi:6-phosphofructokinase 1